MKSEVIIYNGYKFRRYPNSLRLSDAVYFSGWVGKVKWRLHRYKYTIEVGEIPKGMHIHHKDENPLNNELSNYELILPEKHGQHHYVTSTVESKEIRKDALLTKAIPASKEWHGSKEGLDWHKEHGHDVYNSIEVQVVKCDHCGISFENKSIGRSRFCSNACKSAYRRANRSDFVIKQCLQCGKDFESNKYNKTLHCGKMCATKTKRDNRNRV